MENGTECRLLREADIEKVIPLYLAYYNGREGAAWTAETAYRRIHQVWSCEDSCCLLLEADGAAAGFAIG